MMFNKIIFILLIGLLCLDNSVTAKKKKGTKCRDTRKECQQWKNKGYCSDYRDRMMKRCRKTCNFCQDTKSKETSLSHNHDDGKCKDVWKDCDTWKSKGYCSNHPEFMSRKCQKSCHLCKDTESKETKVNDDEKCEDYWNDCYHWKGKGYCTNYAEFMKIKCKKTCNFCKDTPTTTENVDCVDKVNSCMQWSAKGYCKGEYQSYMEMNCKESCNLCGKSNGHSMTNKGDMASKMDKIFTEQGITCGKNLEELTIYHYYMDKELHVKTGSDYCKVPTANEPDLDMSKFIQKDKAYTLIMLDLDDPVVGVESWIHWIVTDLTVYDHGITRFKYQAPGPPLGGGPHRYAFFVFEQGSKDNLEFQSERGNFLLRNCIKKNDLKLVAANYYTVTNKGGIAKDMEDILRQQNIRTYNNLETLNVVYNNYLEDYKIATGADYIKSEVRYEPRIDLDKLMVFNKNYTLIMLDLDDPLIGTKSWIHWVVTNIHKSCNGTTKFAYQAPTPPCGKETHRYVFFLFEQHDCKGLEFHCERGQFQLDKFVMDHKMKLVAANYYTVTVDKNPLKNMRDVLCHQQLNAPKDVQEIMLDHQGPNGTFKVIIGDDYTKSQTAMEPNLYLKHHIKYGKSYALIMLDLDDPVKGTTSWIHWIISGITSRGGKSCFEYQSPAPPMGKGPHRYAFFLFEQSRSGKLNFQSERGQFELANYVKKNNLKLVATTYYTVTYKKNYM